MKPESFPFYTNKFYPKDTCRCYSEIIIFCPADEDKRQTDPYRKTKI